MIKKNMLVFWYNKCPKNPKKTIFKKKINNKMFKKFQMQNLVKKIENLWVKIHFLEKMKNKKWNNKIVEKNMLTICSNKYLKRIIFKKIINNKMFKKCQILKHLIKGKTLMVFSIKIWFKMMKMNKEKFNKKKRRNWKRN